MSKFFFTRSINRLVRPFGVNPFLRAFECEFNRKLILDQEMFEEIHLSNFWGAKESSSGLGGELSFIKAYRTGLARCRAGYGIGSIFDAPFGDLNWMSTFLFKHPVVYAGGDISSEIIARARAAYPDRDLRVFDITADPFPEADLWHCRDCLFHLTFEAVRQALTNFATSGIGHALITIHRARLLQHAR